MDIGIVGREDGAVKALQKYFAGGGSSDFKKNEIKPWLKEQWCIPPEANADFVCAMEDVLEVYQRPESEKNPLVCMDETSRQHIKETRLAMAVGPGHGERHDYEYERNGVSNIFMVFAPLKGWRDVQVTDTRTQVDWAQCMKDVSDVHFPEAERITVVMDNLNTHKPASFYEAFPPEEARRLIDRFEFHYTPKHGSWLDMAEIELGILQRQCLNRRLPDQKALRCHVNAWKKKRNSQKAKVNWRFTTKDARIKLKRLYPSIQN
jgi:hypothetical protein